MRTLSTIPQEVIECIADGREPSVQELGRVARDIWRDICGDDSQAIPPAMHAKARHLSFRAALAALAGAD